MLSDTLESVYADIIMRLKLAGLNTPEMTARHIIKHTSHYEWSDIIAKPQTPLTEAQISAIGLCVTRLETGMPLSRILGAGTFWGLDFQLSADTLDPRADTEVLVDAVLKHVQALEVSSSQTMPSRIIDLGTGSGCILITLLKELSKPRAHISNTDYSYKKLWGLGVDKSYNALLTARENACMHDVDRYADFISSDWVSAFKVPKSQKFDIVVSNPPYISKDVIPNLDKNVQKYDPILALEGGKDGLSCYKILFSQLKTIIKKDGRAFFEIGFDEYDEIARLTRKYKIRIERTHLDSQGIPRVVEVSV